MAFGAVYLVPKRFSFLILRSQTWKGGKKKAQLADLEKQLKRNYESIDQYVDELKHQRSLVFDQQI